MYQGYKLHDTLYKSIRAYSTSVVGDMEKCAMNLQSLERFLRKPGLGIG
jgi:hypothetical protein